MIKKKPRKTILKKRDKKLDTIGYSKLDIMWFFQWLKLALDLESQNKELIVGAKKLWVAGTKKRTKYVKSNLDIPAVRKKTKGIPYEIKVKGWNTINLNELRRLPKIMNMTKNEIFQHFNKWFQKNKHLFGDFSVQLVQDKNNMIDSDDYLTVQIPKSLDRRTIDNQIDTLMKGLKLKQSRKRDITFNRGVQKDVMKKQWKVFKLKTTTDMSNQDIAQEVGYTKKKNSLNVYANKQLVGLRSVQKANESAKYLIINVSKGVFPKTTL